MNTAAYVDAHYLDLISSMIQLLEEATYLETPQKLIFV